jgi:hypothetical protein
MIPACTHGSAAMIWRALSTGSVMIATPATESEMTGQRSGQGLNLVVSHIRAHLDHTSRGSQSVRQKGWPAGSRSTRQRPSPG